MEHGNAGNTINPWAARLFKTLKLAERRARPSSRHTTSGSTRPPTERRPAATASTAPPEYLRTCCSSRTAASSSAHRRCSWARPPRSWWSRCSRSTPLTIPTKRGWGVSGQRLWSARSNWSTRRVPSCTIRPRCSATSEASRSRRDRIEGGDSRGPRHRAVGKGSCSRWPRCGPPISRRAGTASWPARRARRSPRGSSRRGRQTWRTGRRRSTFRCSPSDSAQTTTHSPLCCSRLHSSPASARGFAGEAHGRPSSHSAMPSSWEP